MQLTTHRCVFNHASHTPGAPVLDPRFDCQVDGVWHLLIGVKTANFVADTGRPIVACDAHADEALPATVARHELTDDCFRQGAFFDRNANQCVVS